MEAAGECAPTLGPIGDSKPGKLEGWTSDIIPDRERPRTEKTGGDVIMEERAETKKAASMQERKPPKTRPTAARVCHATRSTQRIHRFLYLVFKQIRLARQQEDYETGHARENKLGVHQ
ncbi:hypothetical protein CSOJ01_13958 [Colletotrichum sojae]|uniref:Uncharacterized protein n=1 Tax=Colletotrichum sojae TaxID=2175907 RepID=A0A8H6IR14_9PEZI|nr:hypothetical protein CSOJ01_13958 [Colletotrichum sojae]